MNWRSDRIKIAAVVYALITLFSSVLIVTASTSATDQDGDYSYTVSGSPSVATITGYTGPGGGITIPSTVGGFVVVAVGDWAFASLGSLVSVVVPKSVTSVGTYAFSFCHALISIDVDPENPTYASVDGVLYNKSLTNLIQYPCGRVGAFTIPSGVTSIGFAAFSSSQSMRSVVLPDSLISIGDFAFAQCGALSSVNMPDSVTSIGRAAFATTSLPSIAIGANVRSIGPYAFSDCWCITSVTIPMSTVLIGEGAFSFCRSLETINVEEGNVNFTVVDGVLYDTQAKRLLQCPCKKAGAVAIPGDIASIDRTSFSHCVFLTSVSIPSSVTSIGWEAFRYCTSMTAIDVEAGNEHFTSIEGVLYNKAVTTLIQCPAGKAGDLIIPEGVAGISSEAFWYCGSLTSVTVPDSVTNIGQIAFECCSSLTSVIIGNGTVRIELCAFRYCNALTSVIIGGGVVYIGDQAFAYCSSLLSISFLGLVAPTVGPDWIMSTNSSLMGHAYATSNFPAPGDVFFGLTMGQNLVSVPGTPTGLSADPANASVILSWTPPAANGGGIIDYYVVYRDGKDVAHIGYTNITVIGLTNGQAYAFAVAAHTAAGVGIRSAAISATPCTVPAPPVSVACKAGTSQVILTWAPPADDGGSPVTGYRVYRSTSLDGIYSLMNASSPGFNYTDSGLTNGQTYYYRVCAINDAGEGSPSDVIIAVLKPPRSGDITIIALTAIVLIGVGCGGALLFLRRGR